ncbi:hypothetical protein LINPERHAP2_LOCUS25253, partial [Linum perenne]
MKSNETAVAMARSKTKASKKKHGQPLESSSPKSPPQRS